MDKVSVPNPSNGYPVNWEDVEFALGLGVYNDGIIQALEGILSAYGDNFIVSGCVATDSDITEGWVMLDGELLKVDAQTTTADYFEKVVTYNSDGNKQTQTGGIEDAYQQNRAVASATTGTLENPATGDPDYMPKATILSLIQVDPDFRATTALYGSVKYSTQAEARGGTNTTSSPSPAALLDAIRNGTVYRATTALHGVVLRALQSTVDTGTNTDEYVTPATLAGKYGALKTLVLDIGDWDMDADASTTVAHGLTFSQIRCVLSIEIRNDSDTLLSDLQTFGTSVSGYYSVNNTDIVLNRTASGQYDSTDYDATGYNRGWIIVQYTP